MSATLSAIENSYIEFQSFQPCIQSQYGSSSQSSQGNCRSYEQLLSTTENAFKDYKKRFLEENQLSPTVKYSFLGSRLLIAGSFVGLLDSRLNLYKKIVGGEHTKRCKTQQIKARNFLKYDTSFQLLALVGGVMEIGAAAFKTKPQDLLNDSKSKVVSELTKEIWRSLALQDNGSRLQRYVKDKTSNILFQRGEKVLANELLKVRLCWLDAYIDFFGFERKYLNSCVGTDVPSRMWMNFHKESAHMRSEVFENLSQRLNDINQISELCTLKIKNLSKNLSVPEMTQGNSVENSPSTVNVS